MMTLTEAASFFNDQTFTEVGGSASFLGQLLPFADSVRSGVSAKRRILDVAATVSIPSNRTVAEGSGQKYIVAGVNEDYYSGDIIRTKYPVLPVVSAYHIRDVGQVLADSGGTAEVYAKPSYIRRVYTEDKSSYAGGYEIYLSSFFSVSVGDILQCGTDYYRAREASRVSDSGFGVVEAVRLTDPVSTASVTHKSGLTIDPATDDYGSDAPIDNVSIFSEPIELNFIHEALGYIPLEAGDKAISFLKSAVVAVKTGDTVGDYLIKAVDDNSTFWTVHGRKT